MTYDPEPLAPGDIIKTNYETGPYRVVDVMRGCTCPNYVEELNAGRNKLPPAPEHIHVTCVKPDEEDRAKNHYWINRYLEEKGRIHSVDTPDEIFVIGKAKGQISLF